MNLPEEPEGGSMRRIVAAGILAQLNDMHKPDALDRILFSSLVRPELYLCPILIRV
jgi:hypothetical protein